MLEGTAFVFLLAVILLALVLGTLYFYSYQSASVLYALSQACFFIMTASPVAYMLSIILPWHYLSKVTFGGKIKINDITVLERANKSSKVFIDKTGTLTTGHLQVAEIVPAKDVSEETLMKAALSTQQNAQHPVLGLALLHKQNQHKPDHRNGLGQRSQLRHR